MRRRTLAFSLALFLPLLVSSFPSHAFAGRTHRPASDCEGGACQYVAVTFEEAKGQYRVQNSSSDRWVKVAAANVAAYASVCVAPGKAEYLPLKSILGPYRAEWAEAGCAPPSGD